MRLKHRYTRLKLSVPDSVHTSHSGGPELSSPVCLALPWSPVLSLS